MPAAMIPLLHQTADSSIPTQACSVIHKSYDSYMSMELKCHRSKRLA